MHGEKNEIFNQRISSAIYLLMLTKWLPLMLWRPGIAAAISKHAFPSSCIERLCWEGWRVGASDGKIEPTKLVSNCYQYSIYIYMITAATYTHTAIFFCLLFPAHSTNMKLTNSDIIKDIMTILYRNAEYCDTILHIYLSSDNELQLHVCTGTEMSYQILNSYQPNRYSLIKYWKRM